MKLKTLVLASVLFAPVLLAFQPKGTSLVFNASEGSTSTKTFTNDFQMSLADMTMLLNGQESPAQPDISLDVNTKVVVKVTDTYVKMSAGAPLELSRNYDSLEQTQSMEMEVDVMGTVQNSDSSTGSESELEGATVIFRLKEGEYVPSFPEEGGDAKLLENLTEDMDLRALLPEGEVSEGDEWKIEPIKLKGVLSPGGDLKMVPEESSDPDMMGGMGADMGSQDDWLTDDIDGEVTATFKGTRETDEGLRVGVILITLKVNNAVDLTEKTREGLKDQELPPGVDEISVNSTDIEVTMEGEATLLWDLAAGHVHSFELSAEITLLVDSNMKISTQGMNMEIENSMEFAGTMTSKVSIE